MAEKTNVSKKSKNISLSQCGKTKGEVLYSTFAEALYIEFDWVLIGTLVLVLTGYVLLHDLLGDTFWAHNCWDSYALQAQAWLDGKVGLGQNYNYLELAVYKNDWFVSFPPFPSVLMLPWVMIYGQNAPNNFIMILYVLFTITIFYKCIRHYKIKDTHAAFFSVALVLGSNMLWMSTMAGVWFQAQLIHMMMCGLTIWAMLTNRRIMAYLCLAFAFGCRPFALVYYPIVLLWFYQMDKKENPKIPWITTIVKNQWKAWVLPGICAVIYMWYNYIRFDNPFEFGHNYLPEFTGSEKGQFDLSYLGPNLHNYFFRGIHFTKQLGLEFTLFDGFLFYIANPVFIIFFVYIIKAFMKKKMGLIHYLIIGAMVLNLIGICLHKTLGGWQFGARYTVDLLPFAFLFILMGKEDEDELKHWEMFIGIIAIMFNMYGTIFMKMNQ